MVASVTTMAGSFANATSAPLAAPNAAPHATAASAASGTGQPVLGRQGGEHGTDGELRPDRDVDLPGDDHQRHPDRHDQHRRGGDQRVEELPPEEVGPDHGQGQQQQGVPEDRKLSRL
jgi:hypothetical protein